MQKNKLVTPVLKWVGGKRQLITQITELLPSRYATYYEPFIGGGAVFFHLQRKKVVINDFNSELVNVYKTIQSDVEALIEDLKKHKNESDYFYEMRALDRSDTFSELTNIEKASRVLYLNKTCFNGLYRVNRSGEFNTPFGRYKNPNIVNEITLRAVHEYLKTNDITILNQDFASIFDNIKKNDFVYLDPPYDPVSKSSNFTGYNQGGFSTDDQIRLRELCDRLNKKGVKFLLSNSATDFIKEQYKNYQINIVQATRSINSNAKKRGAVDEVLIRNYE